MKRDIDNLRFHDEFGRFLDAIGWETEQPTIETMEKLANLAEDHPSLREAIEKIQYGSFGG